MAEKYLSHRVQASPPFTVSANNTTAELSRQAKALRNAADNVYTAIQERSTVVDESTLLVPTRKYEEILNDLEGLYAQDKWGDALDEAETIRQFNQNNLEYAHATLNRARAVHFHEPEEEDRASRKSRGSSRSSTSSARTKALAEAAAAKKQAEYDRIIAEKEHERRQREAEEERHREQRRATYDRDIALLAAEKLAAIADAKLTAIEESMEEEKSYVPSREDVSENAKHRTQQWVDAQDNTKSVDQRQDVTPAEVKETCSPNLETKLDGDTTVPIGFPTPLHSVPQGRSVFSHNTSSPQTTKIQRDVECIETITATNKQLTSSLARQSLPKCHPDAFGGDATLFHPGRAHSRRCYEMLTYPPTKR
ncbi:hypothetical protein OS493_019528 [Desmophyllum pertusum]|uniref:Uncharacterized protein n=1 Tax=Desmophyllum pertusum TaxID=174260 RepID=A0A9X0D349_9CNID|nr:hypothetical protein OS493_019528 [Desmophyllum pertusum]